MDTLAEEAPHSEHQKQVPIRPLVLVGLCLLAGFLLILGWPESTLLIETSPVGADVSLDGVVVGQTPLRLTARPWPLRGKVEVALNAHQSWGDVAEVWPGQTRTVRLTLDPDPTRLAISSAPTGAKVLVDEQEAGTTPLVLTALSPGSHSIEVSLPGYETYRELVNLEPGGELSRSARLTPLASATRQDFSAAALEAVAPATPTPGPLPRGPVEQAVAVVVENQADARPQAGLGAADVVYEAMAEGGISRFLAIYLEGDAPVIGPVRSARHYFVNLAAEYDAPLVHIGASPQGYEALRAEGLPNLDETHGHAGFWRSTRRAAPHNAFTSSSGARAALLARGAAPGGGWGGLLFRSEEERASGTAAPTIRLNYQPWGYRVEYGYDPPTARYARFMEGAPHRDAETGNQLSAASVAVLRVESWVIDSVGRLDMAQVGEGSAVFFMDGVAVEGSWVKTAPAAPTQFLGSGGQPIRLPVGPLWVQLISPESGVDY